MERGIPEGGRGGSRGIWRSTRWAILSALLGVVLLLFPAAAQGAPPSISTAAALGWSNGEITCRFESSHPAMTVSAAGSSDTGFYVGVGQLQEVGPDGHIVAEAIMADSSWTIQNRSNESTYWLDYSANAAETSAAPPATHLGTVAVRVGFTLPAYDDSASSESTVVTMAAWFSNWTWQATDDSLAVILPVWPSYSNSEHLATGPTPSVLSVSNQDSRTLEFLDPATTAQAGSTTGAPTQVPVAVNASLGQDYGTVTVAFGTAASAFHSLGYSAKIGVDLGTAVLGLPLYDFAAVGGAAVVLSALVALGVRAVRSRPSDLVYAEEGP